MKEAVFKVSKKRDLQSFERCKQEIEEEIQQIISEKVEDKWFVYNVTQLQRQLTNGYNTFDVKYMMNAALNPFLVLNNSKCIIDTPFKTYCERISTQKDFKGKVFLYYLNSEELEDIHLGTTYCTNLLCNS